MSRKICLFLILPLILIDVIYALTYKIVLLIISPLLGIFIYINRRNSNLINESIKECFKIIKNKYEMKNIDIGEFKKMSVYGIISFYSTLYHIENLGMLSIMTANLGFMQMLTLVINPYKKDLPQINYDIIYMLNKRIFLVEFYGLMIDEQNEEYKLLNNKIEEINKKLSDVDNFEAKKDWHFIYLSALIGKKYGTKYEQRFMNILKEVMKSFIESSNISKKLNKDDIMKKISLFEDFGNGLIEKGGISTDTFKSLFGIEKTRKFLGNVLFGYYTFKDLAKLN
jgi:hypothetical protein